MSIEPNPIIFFCSCEDCGVKAGEECNDSCYKNSRLNHFIECAPLKNRMRAMSWLYSTLPQWLKNDTMDEGPKFGALYLRREEFVIWKKLKLGEKINYTTLNREVKQNETYLPKSKTSMATRR